MRVISGQLKGLHFSAPKTTKTHPMSDKARGGLFNALGDIEGLTVLDAFSGSGALAIEAVSRGASQATAIEVDVKAYKQIKASIAELGLNSQMNVSQAYVKSWLNTNEGKTYDIILADPPYTDLNIPSLMRLPKHLRKSGILVLSWPGGRERLILDEMSIVKDKKYGDAQLVFYRKIS